MITTPGQSSERIKRFARGFTLVELLIVCAVIAILASMAIPSLVSSRIAANEGSAISAMRSISRGMEAYRLRNLGGNYGYPSDYRLLGSLVPPDVDPLLATGARSGYVFSGGGDTTTWSVTAVPEQFGASGRRSFYVDETGIIRACVRNGEPAGLGDPAIQ